MIIVFSRPPVPGEAKTRLIPRLGAWGAARLQLRLTRHALSPQFRPDFWESPSEDCAGALLEPDGHLSLQIQEQHWTIVPLNEPLYSAGRPESSARTSTRWIP